MERKLLFPGRDWFTIAHMCRLFLFLLFLLSADVFTPVYAAEPGTGTVVRARLQPAERHADVARAFASALPRRHITGKWLGNDIAAQAWTNYLAILDYDRVYFLQSDIEEFRRYQRVIDDNLRKGDVSFAFDVFDVFKKRVRDRCDFVDGLLAKGFDLDRQEVFRWKRDEAAWPKDEAERDELWRKMVKNAFVQFTVTEELLKESISKAETNATPESSEEAGGHDVLDPVEIITKRYRGFLTILEDADPDWVLQRYLSSFSRSYDPHCDYMSPSTVDNFDIEMKLSLVGIGAVLSSEEGAAKVVSLIPGGPAARDGRLQPGDKIIGVAQGDKPSVSILHWSLSKAVSIIRGEINTKVVLTVITASDPSGPTVDIDLVRDEVKLEERAARSEIKTVEGTNGEAMKLGVINLPSFYSDLGARHREEKDFRSASRDVERIIGELKEEGVSGVILDLRGNSGGSLIEAVQMTGLFIRSGPVVIVKKSFGGNAMEDKDKRIVYAGPMVVLVDRLSASASEIVAAALQDYDRAILVGDRKTHGKGTVQYVLRLGYTRELGSLKVTNALFYRVNGTSTQLKGVSPDIEMVSGYSFAEVGEETLPNPLSAPRIDPVKFRPFDDLSSARRILRSNSVSRLSRDSTYAEYTNMLGRVSALSRAEQLPLNIDARRKRAKQRQELGELRVRLASAPGDSEDEAEGPGDFVLSESLNVLRDLVELKSRNTRN